MYNNIAGMTTGTYAGLWSKYRPAILRMMVDADREPQTYQLSNHEFKALKPKQKGGYAFELMVSGGKALNGLKDSEVAQDLWYILQISRRANEMISSTGYQFAMDKQFRLQISKIENSN